MGGFVEVAGWVCGFEPYASLSHSEEVAGWVCGFEPYAFLSHSDPKASVQKVLSHQRLRSPF